MQLSSESAHGERGARYPLAVALVVTVVATALSYLLPDQYAATGVGLWFLGVVYVLVLHHASAAQVASFGLSLGGLFEPVPLEPRRIARALATALGLALGTGLLVFPPFWFGYRIWYQPVMGFSSALPQNVWGEALGQLLGVAFPEEAFYRGYLQSALDRAWPPERRVLGATLGNGVLVSSLLFALGHYLTEPNPGRLAVFFPSLVFGWLRARSGGIGAAIAFHALCNLFASYLGRSYGLLQ